MLMSFEEGKEKYLEIQKAPIKSIAKNIEGCELFNGMISFDTFFNYLHGRCNFSENTAMAIIGALVAEGATFYTNEN